MPMFHDALQREYPYHLDLGTMLKIKDQTGVSLTKPVEALAALADEPLLFARVLWVLAQPTAEKLNLTRDQFFAALSLAELEAAYPTFIEEWTSFFPPPRREQIKQLFQQMNRIQPEALDRLAQTLPQQVAATLDQIGRTPNQTLPAMPSS